MDSLNIDPYDLASSARIDDLLNSGRSSSLPSLPSSTEVERLVDKLALHSLSESNLIEKSREKTLGDIHEPPGPLQGCEINYLVGNDQEIDVGKVISYEFTDNGESYGTEVVTRIDSIKLLNENLIKQLQYLGSEIIKKGVELDLQPNSISLKEEFDELNKQYIVFTKIFSNNNNSLESFIKSSFYRDKLQEIMDQYPNITDFGNNYTNLINQIPLGSPVNFRYQECITTEKNIGFFRLGVITDNRNGFTNLKELKKIVESPDQGEKKIRKINKAKIEAQSKKNFAQINACNYAITQLRPAFIKETLRERRLILSTQMLQLVQEQINKHIDEISSQPEKTKFEMTHLALLNRKTCNIDATGWVHNEENEMLDMNEIFNEFAGKKLIFDGEGPLIDAEGNLHLAQSLKNNEEKSREIQLEPLFLNITVQGHTKNDGVQKEINSSTINTLIKIAMEKAKTPVDLKYEAVLKELLSIKDDLEKHEKSSYQIAENLSIALLKLEIPLSMGCLSAKDRTGYVGARTILHFVLEDIKNPDIKKISNRLAAKVLDTDACAARIVADNTKIFILKCSSLDLPGYSKGVKGKVNRLFYYAKQLGTNPIVTDLGFI